MQIIIIGSKKCQTNKTIFFFIQVCLGSSFCSLHKELIFFYLKILRLDNGVAPSVEFQPVLSGYVHKHYPVESYGVLELECTLHNFQQKSLHQKIDHKGLRGIPFFSQKVIEQQTSWVLIKFQQNLHQKSVEKSSQ